MANTVNSNSMLLPVPVVGQDPGPQYATDVNSCLTIIDGHNHSPGSGVQITPSGININADLPLNSNNLTATKTVRFTPQTSALSGPADLAAIYAVNLDLYYNDGVGNQVRLTQNGAVSGTPGSIANLVSPASASYVSGSETFVFQSDVNTAANLDGRNYILRNATASSNGLTLSPPSAMGSDYTITLPSLPGSTSFLTMDASGAQAASVPVSQGITLSMLAAAIAQSLNPSGVILAYGGTSAPTGYLMCDGAAVSRTTYADLYATIGVAYGYGDNSTTFNVPDLRGRFIRGVTGATANDPDASSRTAMNTGGNTGNNVGSIQSDAFKNHVHQTVNNAIGGGSVGFQVISNSTSAAPVDTLTSVTGGNETRPVNAYSNFIIKT